MLVRGHMNCCTMCCWTKWLPRMTSKTLFFLVIARILSPHVLSLSPGWSRVRLPPDLYFVAKNQTPSFSPSEVRLPNHSAFSLIQEDKRWCSVRALKWCIECTKAARRWDCLFILSPYPYTLTMRETRSCWIVMIMCPHGSPVRLYQCAWYTEARHVIGLVLECIAEEYSCCCILLHFTLSHEYMNFRECSCPAPYSGLQPQGPHPKMVTEKNANNICTQADERCYKSVSWSFKYL